MADPTALFTEAEARAFDKGQLADEIAYPTADITAKEAEIREWLTKVCGVDLIPTTHADELQSGDGTATLLLNWPRVQSVTAASTRSGTTWTALTAAELALVVVDPDGTGMLYRDGAYWPAGVGNVKVTYKAGYTAVPALIKRAALMICVNELPASNAPWDASSYEAGGVSWSLARGDGYQGNWSSIPDVMKAIRAHSYSTSGIA